MSENVRFFLDDCDNDEEESMPELDLCKILKNLETAKTEVIQNDDNVLASIALDYEMNYTAKQLLLICDFYNISKQMKINKYTKTDIINSLVLFENNPNNFEIVLKRKQFWFYINELKRDKFMKKYVLWN
jgi:hypothetical protein